MTNTRRKKSENSLHKISVKDILRLFLEFFSILSSVKSDSADFNQSWYLAENFKNKVKVLQQQFFSERFKADLFDLNIIIYLQKIKNNKLISEKKVQQVMTKLHSSKASKRTDIINNFLKLMSEFLIHVITYLTQDCQCWKYFLKIFKII